MKLKYYLRGLGIGIIVTTIILMISFSGRKEEMSDEEVIARAKQLGMVMQEESSDAAEDEASGDGTDADAQGADEASDGADTDVQGADEASDSAQGVDELTDRADDMPQTPEDGELSAEELLAQTQNHTDADTDTEDQVPASNVSGSFRLTIQKGDVCRVVCEKLAEGGVITDAEALRKYLFEIGYASNMSVGEYDIPYGATNEEIAGILQEGPIE